MKIASLFVWGGALAAAAYVGKRVMDEATAAQAIDWSYARFRITDATPSAVNSELYLNLANPSREFGQEVKRLELTVSHGGQVVATAHVTGLRLAPNSKQVVPLPIVLHSRELLTEVTNIVIAAAKAVFTGEPLPPIPLDFRGTADVQSEALGTNVVLPLNFSLDISGALKDYWKSKTT